jgi:uncharacterized protein YbjT (DUF2867 family)
MKTKQVTVFGGSGLIGGLLIKLLIDDDSFSKIIVVSRSPFKSKSSKVENFQIDFSNPEEIEHSIKNSSIVFSAIGTTQANVKGDKIAYRKIDFEITYSIAKACKSMNIKSFLYISSSGANSKSSSFYMKLKGEIDAAVSNLNLISTVIFRPSLLIGKRSAFRFGELIAQFIMPLFAFIFPKNLKPIAAEFVAKAMVYVSKNPPNGNKIIENSILIDWKKKGFDK